LGNLKPLKSQLQLLDLAGNLLGTGLQPIRNGMQDVAAAARRPLLLAIDDLHLLVMLTAPRTHEVNVDLERAKTRLVDLTIATALSIIDSAAAGQVAISPA
jgi:hypothetical protein